MRFRPMRLINPWRVSLTYGVRVDFSRVHHSSRVTTKLSRMWRMQGHRAFAMRILEGPFDCVWRGEAEAIAFHRHSAYGIFAEDLTSRACNCLSDFGPPIVSQPACQFPRRSTIHNFCQAACQLPTTVEPCGRFVLAGLAAVVPCRGHAGGTWDSCSDLHRGMEWQK